LREGKLKLPPGYYWEWSGQFESQKRATARMKILVPITLFIMIVMLYLGFKRWWIAPIIYFGILTSAAGGFIMLAWWGANLSVAVWVGFLVLFGVADDDGVVISTYLEDIFDKLKPNSVQAIREAVVQAGLKRIRPCLMTLSRRLRPDAHLLDARSRLRRDAADGHSIRWRAGREPVRLHLHRAVSFLRCGRVEVEAVSARHSNRGYLTL
jgi:hypothetical protein